MKREKKTLRKGEEAVPSMRGKLGISKGLGLDKNTPDSPDFDSNDEVQVCDYVVVASPNTQFFSAKQVFQNYTWQIFHLTRGLKT